MGCPTRAACFLFVLICISGVLCAHFPSKRVILILIETMAFAQHLFRPGFASFRSRVPQYASFHSDLPERKICYARCHVLESNSYYNRPENRLKERMPYGHARFPCAG